MAEAPRLKPRTFTEILDASFRLYRENFIPFVGILSIVYVPVTLVLIALIATVFQPILEMQAAGEQVRDPQEFLSKMIGPIIAIYSAILVLYGIAIPIASGALTRAVGLRYLNEPVSIGKCYGHILRMVFKYIFTVFLAGLVIALGFPFYCVPGFLFAVFFAFSSQVCVMEGLGGTAAMGRSFELTKGYRWIVFGMWLLSIILPIFLSMILGLGLDQLLPLATDSILTQSIVSQAIQQVFGLLIQPYFIVAWILLYYDLRIRKEAFDLEVLAKTMGAPGGFFPGRPAP